MPERCWEKNMDDQVKTAIHSLVDLALQAERVMNLGQYPTGAFQEVIVLNQMIDIIKREYTKPKEK